MKRHIFVDEPYGCEAVEFYKVVFGAIELKRAYEEIETDDEIKGSVRVVSCELQLGSTSIIVSELTPNSSWRKIRTGATRAIMLVYVKDLSSVFAQALNLGSVHHSQFFDDDGVLTQVDIRDPYGITWCIRPVSMMHDSAAEGTSHDSAAEGSS